MRKERVVKFSILDESYLLQKKIERFQELYEELYGSEGLLKPIK